MKKQISSFKPPTWWYFSQQPQKTNTLHKSGALKDTQPFDELPSMYKEMPEFYITAEVPLLNCPLL